APSLPLCHDPSPGPPHIIQQPPNSPKTPDAPPNFHPCPAPILVSPDATPANSDALLANSDASLANSDAFLANSNGPLANFNAFPAATDTYSGSSKRQESPPLFLIFATIINSTPWFLRPIPEYHDNLGVTHAPKQSQQRISTA
ncbi:hypothetical protein C0989_002975, partial [Termitomyces sp. Mn162]